MKEHVLFTTAPLPEEIELTGPMAAKLYVSSSTEDMDIFATVQAFAPDGSEVTFPGASEPAAPIAQGWLRVSQRKLDPERSRPWQPYHAHDEEQKLVPGHPEARLLLTEIEQGGGRQETEAMAGSTSSAKPGWATYQPTMPK